MEASAAAAVGDGAAIDVLAGEWVHMGHMPAAGGGYGLLLSGGVVCVDVGWGSNTHC